MKDNYEILITKLDLFIRKYYKNQLIRGALYSLAFLVLFFLVTNTLEYFGHFTPLTRTLLFYAYLLGNLAILGRLVVLPLVKLNKIGKIISHEQAAVIIGTHFPEVADKLLNTLQLRQMQDFHPEHTDLIEASIGQKINHLQPIPFQSAIDLAQNKKYLKFALPPLVLLVIILLAAPSFITEPTTRLINHTEYFETPAPFSVTILNKKLEAAQQEDFTLNIRLEGNEIPDQLLIEYNNARYKLTKENNILYHYQFKNLQKNVSFQIVTEDYTSREYELNVLPKPIVLNFQVELSYPGYIHRENEKLVNNGDLLLPAGTVVTWKFYTRDTREIKLRFKDKLQVLEQKSADAFQFTASFLESQSYSVTTFNEYLKNKDSLAFSINVIPDSYPLIQAEEYHDSVYEKRLYFKGDIKDDYGFRKLTFNYRVIKGADSLNNTGSMSSDTLGINLNVNQQAFYHFFDLSTLNIKAGDGVEYYFEVWDNDGIHGSKSSRSQKMFFKAPTQQEASEKAENENKELKEDIQQAIKDAKDLQKKVEDLNKKLLDKKEIGWQEKNQINELLQKQEALQKKVEDIKKDQLENSIREQQNMEMSEEIMEKQQQLEELFDQIIPEEMKEQIRELQELMKEFDKNKVNDMLDKIQMNSEDLEKQLDRNLEIFKQLEFEKKLEETKNKLDSLAKKQDQLSEESLKKDSDTKDLEQKQDQLNKEFEQFSKDMQDLEEKNKDLEDPNMMPDTKQDQQDIKNDMNQSTQNLKDKKGKKAAQSQKNAAQKMKDLSKKMDQMQQQMEGADMEQDMKSLRDILENLVQLSFDQEDLMLQVNKVKTYDPQYLKIIQRQKKIKDDLQMVEDSLYALAKRQASIKPMVTREVTEINMNVEKSLEELTERRTGTASGKQQYVMTGVNNLALLLQESLDQMQQMMQQAQGQGKSGCSKPKIGSGDKPMKSMRELQEQLNQQMQQMKDQMEKGQQKPGPGQQSMSEQLARAAAQQEAIRKQLQKLRDELAKEGKGNTGNLNKAIQDMEQTETDLVNKMITNQTLMRQKEILTRLLESEKAMRQREQEEKRESTEAKNQLYSNPKNFFEYNKIKSRETELLKTVPPTLKPFYKNKVSAYFYNFEE